jgi:ribosome-binding protein aMBF1 (putative translation factor)
MDQEWDDDSGAVMRAVGRQIKLWREAAGMKQVELGAAIGYGEELVSAVERARRIPRPESGTRRMKCWGRAARSRR